MDKQGRKVMAQVCDKLAIVTKKIAKDGNKKQKGYMEKQAQQFKNLGKIWRSIKDDKK